MKPRAKSALALAQVRKSVGRSDKKSGKKSDKKILDHLKDYPAATLEELQELTGLSSGGIRKRIWGQTM